MSQTTQNQQIDDCLTSIEFETVGVNSQKRLLSELVKICNNIINNPTNDKFKSLSFNRIQKRFETCPNALNILLISGFEKKPYRQTIRLIFNSKCLDKLKCLKHKLCSITYLMNSGISFHDSKDAIKMSIAINDDDNDDFKNEPKCINQNMHLKYLLTMGFERDISLVALAMFDNDVHLASDYIINYLKTFNYKSITFKEVFTPQKSSIDTLRNILPSCTQQQALCALQFCSGNVDDAVECIIQRESSCYGNIKDCFHFTQLKEVLNNYNPFVMINNINTITMSNHFNHLFFKHNSNEDFKYIYDNLKKCDITKCKIQSRYYKNREFYVTTQNKDDQTDSMRNELQYYETMDQIHCHFIHSYDIGHRSYNENKQQNDNDDQKVALGNKTLYMKHGDLKRLNKFKNLYNIDKIVDYYSFGVQYYYSKHYQNLYQQDMRNQGYLFRDWFVKPKYKSFKEESMNNALCKISNTEWIKEYSKGVEKLATDYAKTLIARPKQRYINTHEFFNDAFYEVDQGTPISLYHLIAIILYCTYSNLAYKFSETFRKINGGKETDYEMQQRHRNFYYLSKYIAEAVNIFSNESTKGNHKRFYHGIDKQVIFNSVTCYMYQPLSTTSAWEVALNFSNLTGMVVELSIGANAKYFDCGWVSPFSNENELLFVLCPYLLTFVNITNIADGISYKEYVDAISIINRFKMGFGFATEDLFQNVFNNIQTNGGKTNPQCYGGKPIPPRLKLLAILVLKHELNRYFPSKYPKMKSINKYCETLLHQMCVKTKRIHIRWNLMETELKTKCVEGIINGTLVIQNHGYALYQGYFFLKYLLCENDCQMMKLNILLNLFPNAELLSINNMSSISPKCLQYILEYLSINNNVTSLIQCGLQMYDDITNVNLFSLVCQYYTRFFEIGWRIAVTPRNQIQFCRDTHLHLINEQEADQSMHTIAEVLNVYNQ